MLILAALYIIPQLIGLWKLFEKAGRKGWEAIIPFYNLVIMLKIVNRPWWWLFYVMIPLIGQFIYIGVYWEFLRAYGKGRILDLVLGFLFAPIYLPYLGFNKDVSYVGPPSHERVKDSVQEWSEAIGFAVIAATLIRWLIMEAYTIPTPSMENSLLVGDFLFVSKFHYGTRTPKTPLQVPLTHQKIWFTNIPSYSKAVQLPQYRLPGISHVKREDVVVFNVPPIRLNEGVDYPVDLKTNYIKRCVGISGDVIEIKNKQVFANGTPLTNPPGMRFSYKVVTKEFINDKNLEKLGLDSDDIGYATQPEQNKVEYMMHLDSAKAGELRQVPYITSVEEFPAQNGRDPDIFSHSSYAPWNRDNFGPLTIPKEGMTISVNDSTLAFYGETIVRYDHNDDAKVEGGKLFIDGKEQTSYTFNQNYYFMMGDNRHDSLDSRFWGFVPEDHIVGKAFFIWLSLDKNAGFFSKVRWSRFFDLIE
ncbi:MAG TPA: signal peptidase I [Cyclobacteriaceae bacterium]|nr:signal peptidase I [Cyclobacteriaceae bacterium]